MRGTLNHHLQGARGPRGTVAHDQIVAALRQGQQLDARASRQGPLRSVSPTVKRVLK